MIYSVKRASNTVTWMISVLILDRGIHFELKIGHLQHDVYVKATLMTL